ncbi:MAG: flagellar hook-basal body complex protein FliE [Lachnospiraceae bacterium]|nr:flagellar hook-basal body complex protein FliE [Lachnospiraceae bacterium]
MVRAMTGATNDVTKLTNVKGLGQQTGQAADGTMFEAALNSAINNITRTNSYLSDAENQEILFALGESDSTHDLTIALEKASTALQYTVAIRDRVLDAYKELMQIQI